MLFGQSDNFCPEARKCYCDVFGLCDLKDCTPGECKGQYEFPKKPKKSAAPTSSALPAKKTEASSASEAPKKR